MTRDALYRECAAAGMTHVETARRLGVTPTAVRQWLNKHHDVQVAKGRRGRPPNHPYQRPEMKAAVDALTPEQRADFDTLVKRGGYTHAQALEAVTRPRVTVPLKIRRAG